VDRVDLLEFVGWMELIFSVGIVVLWLLIWLGYGYFQQG